MMAEVLRRFGQIHWRELVARGDALIERREDAEPRLTGERWLADEEQRERAPRIGVPIATEQLSSLTC